jgi:anti-sigma factor RsiW
MSALRERIQMKRDHRWAQSRHSARLSAYIDGDLNQGERRRLERHADLCPECGPLLRALTVTVFRLRQLRARRPAHVAPKAIERLRAEELRR